MITSRMALRSLSHGAMVQTLRARKAAQVSSRRATVPARTYIICTTPRSGSWLLSDGLASTGVAGRPREWFNPLQEQQICARWRMSHDSDLGLLRYLAVVRAQSTTPNGVSGIKLHYYQFAGLADKFAVFPGCSGLTSAKLLTQLYPDARYVWLTRRDKLRQALSFLQAVNTDVWWRFDRAGPSRVPDEEGGLRFDDAAVDRAERLFARNDARWRDFFEQQGIKPFTIQYEDFSSDYVKTIAAILEWLGVPEAAAIAIPPPRLTRQFDARSEEWIAGYKARRAAGPQTAGTSFNARE